MVDALFVDGTGAPYTELPTHDASVLAQLQAVLAKLAAVTLDGPTLAALEQITATISGPVAISSLPEVEVKNDAGAPLNVFELTGLLPKQYDSFVLGYVTPTDPDSEIATVTLKQGGATVATLTLTYDGLGRLATGSRA